MQALRGGVARHAYAACVHVWQARAPPLSVIAMHTHASKGACMCVPLLACRAAAREEAVRAEEGRTAEVRPSLPAARLHGCTDEQFRLASVQAAKNERHAACALLGMCDMCDMCRMQACTRCVAQRGHHAHACMHAAMCPWVDRARACACAPCMQEARRQLAGLVPKLATLQTTADGLIKQMVGPPARGIPCSVT